ncbi:hypothetical protein GWL_15920 [Herbaspirillum sp. GW103]|nr:hypothetical protein GWL_15920 [Herbaspirillum sp. GW103]
MVGWEELLIEEIRFLSIQESLNRAGRSGGHPSVLPQRWQAPAPASAPREPCR